MKFEISIDSPDDALEKIKFLFDALGNRLTEMVLQPGILRALADDVKGEESEVKPPSSDLWEHVRSLQTLKESIQNRPRAIDYFFTVMGELATVTNPKFLIISPTSIVKSLPIWKIAHTSPMYTLLFGMIVHEDNRLDDNSFVICGSSGFGTDPTYITHAYKGFIESL
jgi:hypothetical protein